MATKKPMRMQFNVYDYEKKHPVSKYIMVDDNKTVEQAEKEGNEWIQSIKEKTVKLKQEKKDKKQDDKNRIKEEEKLEKTKKIKENIKEIIGENFEPKIKSEIVESQIPISPDLLRIPLISENDSFNIIKKHSNTTSFCGFVCGSSKSGKTTFLSKLIPCVQRDNILIFCSNSLQNPIYDDIKEGNNTLSYNVFRDDIVKTCYGINNKTNNHYKFMVITDDVVDHKNSSELMKCYTIYRNNGISTIVSIQDPELLRKTNRSNTNFVYALHINNSEGVKDMVEKYVGSYLTGNLNEKIEKYKYLTRDYKKIFIDLLDDKIYIVQ